jgi:RNA polymerase sigma-70 factor (ECF subfamily)
MTMDDEAALAAQAFEHHRTHLRSVAYRMLGSISEADDAVQEAWLRLARSDTGDVRNLRAWLTTVVARVCLDMLRSRSARREQPLDDVQLPDPVVTPISATDPEEQAVLADSVGLALLVVLDTLSPNERLAFVLHDIFGVPFEQIGSILDRSEDAAKQLASRARGRLRGAPAPPVDVRKHREVVDAFLAASRSGDFDGLLAVLHPDVVLRADAGSGPFGPSLVVRGAEAVVAQATRYAGLAKYARPVLVNGLPGFAVVRDGVVLSLLSAHVDDGRIVELDIIADPERLRRLGVADAIG